MILTHGVGADPHGHSGHFFCKTTKKCLKTWLEVCPGDSNKPGGAAPAANTPPGDTEAAVTSLLACVRSRRVRAHAYAHTLELAHRPGLSTYPP